MAVALELLLEHERGDDQHRIRATVDATLTQDEVDEVGFAIQEAVARIGRRRMTKPHTVHHKPEFQQLKVMIASPNGEVQAVDPLTDEPVFETIESNRPLYCPDCRRPLIETSSAGAGTRLRALRPAVSAC